MLPLELYYRKLAKGKARLARVAEAKDDEPARYALYHYSYDPESGVQGEEKVLAVVSLKDVTDEKKRLKDKVDLLAQLQADIGAVA